MRTMHRIEEVLHKFTVPPESLLTPYTTSLLLHNTISLVPGLHTSLYITSMVTLHNKPTAPLHHKHGDPMHDKPTAPLHHACTSI